MKAVVQRVKHTTLEVDGALISEIPFGLAVFLGVKVGDGEKEAESRTKVLSEGVYLNDKTYSEMQMISEFTGASEYLPELLD